MAATQGSVLITRAEDEAQDYIAAVRALGLTPHCQPVLDIRILPTDLSTITAQDALILTSARAVEALARLKVKPALYVVGRQTAQAASAAGFIDMTIGKGGAEELTRRILLDLRGGGQPEGRRYHYLRGAEVSFDLKAALAEAGVPLAEHIVYEAQPVPRLSPATLACLDSGTLRAVLFLSARGAGAFADLVRQYGREASLRGTKALCLAPGMLESLGGLPFAAGAAADHPDRGGLLDLLNAAFGGKTTTTD